MANDSSQPPRSRRRIGAAIGTVAALVGIATGVLTLTDQIFEGDDEANDSVLVERERQGVARFRGVAGHLEEAGAVLDFLEQHDGRPVRLEVGFPEIPSDDYTVEDVPQGDGTTRQTVTQVRLFTECRDLPPGKAPDYRYNCLAAGLTVNGPAKEGSSAFLQHGVPTIKGYFSVDVTGGLQMGVMPINLKPLTFEEARR
jgi:hypothetical protein